VLEKNKEQEILNTTSEPIPDYLIQLQRLTEMTNFASSPDPNNWEQEKSALMLELEQKKAELEILNNSLTDNIADGELLERINHLEEALEEALNTIDGLNHQLTQKEILAQELAATEEVATIQQQALSHLKQQLAGQQQALEQQINHSQAKEQSIHELLSNVENLTQTLQGELERLRTQMAQNRAMIQNGQKQLEKQLLERDTEIEFQKQRVAELQSQILAVRSLVASLELQLVEQEQHIEVLYNRLGDRGNLIKQLEEQIKQTQDALEAQSQVNSSLVQTQDIVKEQNVTINTLYQKIESLENHLTRQMKIQSRLQQACQELTQQCNDYQIRNTELEKQTVGLQEQLQKHPQELSQQMLEYTSMIDYWKQKYQQANTEIVELKATVEKLTLENTQNKAIASTQDYLREISPNSAPTPEVNLEVIKHEEILNNISDIIDIDVQSVIETLSEKDPKSEENKNPEVEVIKTEEKRKMKPRPVDLPTFLSNSPMNRKAL
jgi:chromosome segregation ATPase